MNYFSNRITLIYNGERASRKSIVWKLPKGAQYKNLISVLTLLQDEGIIRGFSFTSSTPESGPISKVSKAKECFSQRSAVSKFVAKVQANANKFAKVSGVERSSPTQNSKERVYLNIFLKYDSVGKSVINSVYLVSTPGRRVYVSSNSLWQPQSTSGFFVLSTTSGILTDIEARRYNVGGEVLFGVT